MSWGYVAVGGAVLVSGYMSSEAQKEAAAGQEAGAGAGIAETRRQFDAMQTLLAPYTEAATGVTTGGEFDPAKYLRDNPDVAADSYYGSRPEAHYQNFGKNEGRAFPTTPVVVESVGSLQMQRDLLGLGTPEAQTAAISAIEQGPQYQTLVQQGEEALLQNVSATGGLRGGNVQGALAQYRPQLLSQLIQQQFENLGGITAIGQSSAAMTGGAGMQAGSDIAALQEQAATAGAASTLGQAQTQASTLGSLAGLFAGYQNKSNTGGSF